MTATKRRAGALDAVRGVGVMLGGSVVLVGAAAVSVGAAARGIARRRRPHRLALAGLAGFATYVTLVRPWLRSWGATKEEQTKALPGDELVDEPGMQTTRAVTIDAPVEKVWPWLAQMGQERGGFYSYEWLENLAGCRMKNADEIRPEWQERTVGETVNLHWASGLELARFDPPRSYCFEGWYFALELQNGRTRLYARGRVRRGVASIAYGLLLELPHFVMERKMLLGIKERAERA